MITANQVRSANGNIRLAFLIWEDKIDPDDLGQYTPDELKQFERITSRKEIKDKIRVLLQSQNTNH